jgi:uncharacterized membrane-anchored protein
MLITRNEEATNREMARIVETREGVTKGFEALDKFSYSDKGKATLDACKNARKTFVAASGKLEDQIKAKQWDEALKHFDGAYRPAFTDYTKMSVRSSTSRRSWPKRPAPMPRHWPIRRARC